MSAVKASEIAAFLEKPLIGEDVLVDKIKPSRSPEANCAIFLWKYSPELLEIANGTNAVLVVASPEYEGRLVVPHIITPRPRLALAEVVQRFFAPAKKVGIARTAVIASTAKLGKDVSVGDFSVIGENVQIGDNTEIRDHVVIRDNCIIGKDCLIKSNTVIGEEGFGFEFEDDGTPIRIPHVGRVVIGDHVEIGALNIVARGTMGDTVISNGVKIDDHVFIAHNVSVGENSVIIAGAEVSGSVRIGRNVWIAPQATIIQQAEIGDDAMVGIGAVVIKSVEPNVIVVGNPAKVLRKRFEC
jgi:UDP-3-O-[3-hydroxymyristoyl] glucosamine N-acyltransferase